MFPFIHQTIITAQILPVWGGVHATPAKEVGDINEHLFIALVCVGELQDRASATARDDCRRRQSIRRRRRPHRGHHGHQDAAAEHAPTSPLGRCSSWKERFPADIIRTWSCASRLQCNSSCPRPVYRLSSNCRFVDVQPEILNWASDEIG